MTFRHVCIKGTVWAITIPLFRPLRRSIGFHFEKNLIFPGRKKKRTEMCSCEVKECLKRRKKNRVTVNWIENSTVDDASKFFVAVGPHAYDAWDAPGRKFRHPGDWMNSVNKKCALGHCASCTEKFNDASVSFSILLSAVSSG